MTRALIVLLAFLTACGIYTDGDDQGIELDGGTGLDATEAINPRVQCHTLVAVWCSAAAVCGGWDANTGPCADVLGERCERNQTALAPSVMGDAERTLGVYECGETEIEIVWPDRRGEILLGAMQSWPVAP